MKKLKKHLIKLFFGNPVKGNPVVYTTIYKTQMPIEGMTLEQWQSGEWSRVLNSK